MLAAARQELRAIHQNDLGLLHNGTVWFLSNFSGASPLFAVHRCISSSARKPTSQNKAALAPLWIASLRSHSERKSTSGRSPVRALPRRKQQHGKRRVARY